MSTRTLPDPNIALGFRRDGRPILPILGASSEDPSNDEATLNLSQKHLNTLMAREKDQGGRAAVRTLVDKLGFSSTSALEQFITQARHVEQEQLTEAQHREQALAEREQAAIARETAAATKEREASRRSVLLSAGAAGRDLDDAVALLRVTDDADDSALEEAVQELKERRPELFSVAASSGPAAPGGAPASVPPPRPGGVDRTPGAAGLEMARRRGLISASD